MFPTQGFAGRTVHVEVSGDETTWDTSAAIDFGSGVTVSNITVASPTDLEADIAIDASAPLGPHDVTVTSNGTFTLKQAFAVASPVTLTFTGDVAQGGLPFFTINNLDVAANPFDTTSVQDANGDAIFTNIAITSPTGVDMTDGISNVTEFQITGRAFIDTNATAGDVTVVSGPQGGAQVTSDAGTAMVTTRAATALTAGSDTTAMIDGDGGTQLFSLTAAGSASLALISLTTTDSNAQPLAAVMTDGTWATALVGSPQILTGVTTLDLSVLDQGTEGGYSFTINASADALDQVAEGNDTTDNANATTTNVAADASLPYEMTNATLSSATDVDVIKLTNIPAGVHIHVNTLLGPDAATDTQVDIEDSKGASISGGVVDGGTPGGDGGFSCGLEGVCGEDVDSDATAATGTFFVQISAGAEFSTSDEDYVVVIFLD